MKKDNLDHQISKLPKKYMNESQKESNWQQIQHKINKPSRRKYWLVYPATAVVIGLFALIIFLNFGDQDVVNAPGNDYSEAEEKISEAFGFDMSVVEPEGHSLSFVKLHSKGPFDDQIENATFGFFVIEGEKKNTRTDEEINEEDSLNMEYIYGPYDGDVNFHTTISVQDKLKHLINPNISYETEELNGQTIYYLERRNTNSLIVRTFFEDIMYKVEVNLNDHISKEDAFGYVGKVITELNQ